MRIGERLCTKIFPGITTIILVGLLALIFVKFALSASSSTAEYAPIQKNAYSLRAKLFILFLLIVIPIIGYTLTKMPYISDEQAKPIVSKTVNAIGYQWYWKIDDATAKVGEQILYKVTSADVNHGFGIYDPDMNVIAQTQAMPDYENNLLVSFPKAGTYKILCLEYCGLAHHAMVTEITVSE